MSNFQLTSSSRILGVGNAGVNFLDRLLMNAPAFSGLVAINNDAEALAASVVPTQISLSAEHELVEAFATMTPRLMEEIAGASIVLLCGGLGGRTASTLLPQIAAMSKSAKMLTLACVTQPFSFEGKRIQSVAATSLAALEKICDGVILLDNNNFCLTNASTSALGDTFAASDEAMEVCLPAILAMLSNKGPVRITRAQLLAALSRPGATTYFGHGEATGANRLHEAMERVIKSPLFDRGRALKRASTIFVLLRGPKDLSFAEAQVAMQAVERLVGEESDIQLSVNADEPSGAPLQIFVLATVGGDEKNSHLLQQEAVSFSSKKPPISHDVVSSTETLLGTELPFDTVSEDVPQQQVEASRPAPEPKQVPTQKPKQIQGALDFTAAQRGRFDKSEPTIVEGEDLDTPTYLRLGLKLTFS